MTTTMTAPITATTMLEMLMPVTSATLSTVPATQPPTTAPTIPRTIVSITPSPPPMIMLVMNPAIAPRTIQERIPTLPPARSGAIAGDRDQAPMMLARASYASDVSPTTDAPIGAACRARTGSTVQNG